MHKIKDIVDLEQHKNKAWYKQKYRIQDKEILDYQCYKYLDKEMRGPKPNLGSSYFACLGAAQTFGRYCEKPFPNLLSNKLGVDVLNWSNGGAGPLHFLQKPEILEAVNNARFAIVQVLSARSGTSNSVYESLGLANVIRRNDQKKMRSEMVFRELVNGQDPRGKEKGFIADLIEETRENYVFNMIQLLEQIKVPKILFWFSVRSPLYKDIDVENLAIGDDVANNDLTPLFNDFPQMVNQEMVDVIKLKSNLYVECISSEGLPHDLIDFQGKKVGVNNYYPSPEMHEEAAAELLPLCQQLLATN